MGQATIEQFFGGAVLLTPTGSSTLRWWHDRRVQTIRPTSSGFTMTVDLAGATTQLPWGGPALVVINPPGSGTTFTLAAAGWSIANLPASRAVLIYRVKNGGTQQVPTPQWWPSIWTIF